LWERVIEVLAGFGVFEAVDDYLPLCSIIVRATLQVAQTGAGPFLMKYSCVR